MSYLTADATPVIPAVPAVGIFWLIDHTLLVDRSTLKEAEVYGERLTHAGGHYERWNSWQKLGAKWLRARGIPDDIILTEYDEWPRGRIVYEIGPQRFIIYADRRILTTPALDHLVLAFHLSECRVLTSPDPHYR